MVMVVTKLTEISAQPIEAHVYQPVENKIITCPSSIDDVWICLVADRLKPVTYVLGMDLTT